jgi:predicted metal-dependent phosphoesterase TrpH
MSQSPGQFAIDFHVHTSFSYDCPMPPKLVIELARRRGLAGIAVTDHDTIAGALAARDANRYSDFLVIPGIEVKSDLGDIIGLYLDRQIQSKQFGDVIREIHDKGGVAYVPHPIRTFGAARMAEVHRAHPEINLWEMYNGRYEPRDFVQARYAFESLGIECRLCGSDAHFPWDVGVFRTVLPEMPSGPEQLVDLSTRATLVGSPRRGLALSAGISLGAVTKACKRGDYRKVGRFVAALPWKALRKSLHGLKGRGRA